MKHVSISIKGKVQGVFFRLSTQKKALELGLFGWVRNEPDGTVSAVAEGNQEKLEEFLNWCKTGPDSAKVEKVDYEFFDKLEGFKDFKLRR